VDVRVGRLRAAGPAGGSYFTIKNGYYVTFYYSKIDLPRAARQAAECNVGGGNACTYAAFSDDAVRFIVSI
jgi:hypothetical protein